MNRPITLPSTIVNGAWESLECHGVKRAPSSDRRCQVVVPEGWRLRVPKDGPLYWEGQAGPELGSLGNMDSELVDGAGRIRAYIWHTGNLIALARRFNVRFQAHCPDGKALRCGRGRLEVQYSVEDGSSINRCFTTERAVQPPAPDDRPLKHAFVLRRLGIDAYRVVTVNNGIARGADREGAEPENSFEAAQQALYLEAVAWLDKERPQWRDIASYWDEV